MKKILITLLATLTLSSIAFSQVQVVTDPSLLQKAIDQALREAERMALQEAQKKLQEVQADAINKVSDALKNSGILGDFFDKQVKILSNAKSINNLITNFNLTPEVRNNARNEMNDLVKKSDKITKLSKAVLSDNEVKGNDTQRLLLLKQLEQEQNQCEVDLYGIRDFYERSSDFNNSINSISK